MGFVKDRRISAIQKQQRVRAGMRPPMPESNLKTVTKKDKDHAR